MTILEKLSNYIASTDPSTLNAIQFLNQNPDVILNADSFSDFLYSDESDLFKLQTLLALYQTKEKEGWNRPRKTGEFFDSYSEYLVLTNNTKSIDKILFYTLYSSINNVPLKNDELSCSQKSIDAIEYLKRIGESRETILKFLKSYSNNPSKFRIEKLKNLSNYSFDEKLDIANAFSNSCNALDTTYHSIIGALCYCEHSYNYDFVLENIAILQRFCFSVENTFSIKQPILIINPSMWFLKKWIERNPLSKRKTYFCFSNNDYKEIIENKLSNNNIFFISFVDLEQTLSDSQNIPTNVLFFGNHFTNEKTKEDVFNTLLKYVITKTKLHYYDFDFEFTHNNTIYSENILSRDSVDVNISRIWMFPSRKENGVIYKRTILIELDYGYINEIYSNEFKLYRYRIDKNYNIPYLTSIIYEKVCDKQSILFGKESLRKFYYDSVQEKEKKTNKSREKKTSLFLSDEVVFKFGFVDSKTRARTSCYFFNNEEVKESRISPTKFKTEEEAKHWATYVYPFSKTEKGKYIQQIVYDEIFDSYKGKQLCLSSVIYMNYKIFTSLPLKLQEEMKFIIFSSIGEYYIDQLSKEDLLFFLTSNYLGNKRNIHIYEILSVLERFYDCAIDNYNVFENTATLVLKELKSNERNIELAEINDALTLKNMSSSEMNFIYKKCLSQLKNNVALAIGTLIRLVLGLEPNIICALLWRDLISFERNGITVYQLVIKKQVNNEGSSFLSLERNYHNRLLPIPSFLAEILLEEKERQLKDIAYGNEEYLLDCTIVSGNDFVLLGQAQILSPLKLYKYNRKLFLDKKMNGRKLDVPDNKGGTLQTNIDYFVGDIFKTNLRHYYLVVFDEFYLDDVFYLLGIKASCTLYSNYYDYRNIKSQFRLFTQGEKVWKKIIKN